MPTKEELAHQLKVDQLKALAAENEVDLGEATKKDEIVAALVASNKVTKADIDTAVGETSSDGSGGGVPATDADEASPTGGANLAGTPASQLDQAPPMTDESGSNIPSANLTQPLAGDLPNAPSTTVESLDPALTDPVETAAEVHEGTVNDAKVRAEGVGSGDVEIATVPKGKKGAKEYFAALSVEDSVILGEHELIPERLVGRRAFVVDAPRYLVPIDKIDEVWISVRTRDEINANLTVPLSAVEVVRGGLNPTVRG